MRVRAFLMKGDFGLAFGVVDVGVGDKHPEVSFESVEALLILDAEVLVGMVTDDIRAVQYYLSTQLGQATHFHTDGVGSTDVELIHFLFFRLQEDWNTH